MKKLNLLFVLVFCIAVLGLPGCGDSDDETSNAVESVIAWAQGVLDTSFDTDGILVDDLGGGNDDEVFGLTFQTLSPEKIVVVGTSNNDFMVARYNQDGTLDTSFDTDGMRTDDLGSLDWAYDAAIQSDGKIVVAGWGNGDYVVARYNTDGTPDAGFGVGGFRIVGGVNADRASAVAIQTDGSIVTAGWTDNGADIDILVGRFDTFGTADVSFGTLGFYSLDMSGGNDLANAIAIQPDGKILVAGYVNTGIAAVIRLNTDGTPDFTFDADGIVTTPVGDSSFVYGLAVQTDGKIVIAGQYFASGDYHTFLARYNPDGSLDTSFDFDGIVTTPISTLDGANDLVLQSDGRIVIAGSAEDAVTGIDFMVARYLTDGTLDPSFGTGGVITTDISGFDDIAHAVGIQSDGRIVAVGISDLGGAEDTVIVRYK